MREPDEDEDDIKPAEVQRAVPQMPHSERLKVSVSIRKMNCTDSQVVPLSTGGPPRSDNYERRQVPR